MKMKHKILIGTVLSISLLSSSQLFALDRNIQLLDLIVTNNLTKSKSEARRMIEQGAVRIDGEKVDMDIIVTLCGNDGPSSICEEGDINIKYMHKGLLEYYSK